MAEAHDKFFVHIVEEDGKIVRYGVSFKEIAASDSERQTAIGGISEVVPQRKSITFHEVLNDFKRVMGIYLQFIPLAISFGPALASAMASTLIKGFAERKGTLRRDLSSNELSVYELGFGHIRQFQINDQEMKAFADGTSHIPKTMIIGLISAYDYFLSQLLSVVFNIKSDIVFTSEKTISYDELIKYKSIDEIRNSIVEREIESIIRESHHDQFKRLENRFNMTLRSDLKSWPSFIELCERRNLFTHTGGVITQQYLTVCETFGCGLKNTIIGQSLDVSPDYHRKAVSIVYEIGAKLCFVLWRKFAKKDFKDADTQLNELCYELIVQRQYSIAEVILIFCVEILKRRGGEEKRIKMMTVNLANAVRLQGNKERARAILDKEDWSASDDSFNICVAAVREDVGSLIKYMKKMGANGSLAAEDYRTWPVFLNLRRNEDFSRAFFEIFGSELIAVSEKPSILDS
jgi:hypothetical protein